MATAKKNNVSQPDYRCAQYVDMSVYWSICQHIKQGTSAIRENRMLYLPKFEYEDPKDYEARVNMTFVNDHYAQTLSDHVGLVFATMPELSDDVSQPIRDILENIDGEGTHWQVFIQTVLETALDYGHAIMLTDFPQVNGRMSKREAKARKLRPYVALYDASDIISWKVTTVGGVRVVTQVVLHETFEEDDDLGYGSTCRDQYRVLKQAVTRDEYGTAIALGALTWEVFREKQQGRESTAATLVSVGNGLIEGPEQLPIRIVYGGLKLGVLHTRPHLIQLAYSNIQETQLESDYATVMHKCNVPTPVFIGRNVTSSTNSREKTKPIQMGQGIDIPVGGSAMFLEPSGAALNATRLRLEDLRSQMRRQGAFVHEGNDHMTATEAAIYARQRNARLVRAARSLKDASEGVLSDIAAFMPGTKGGSIKYSLDFAANYDTTFAELCLKAYQANALPLDATLTVLATGKLPEDFNAEDTALRMMAEQADTPDEMTGDPATAPQDPAQQTQDPAPNSGKQKGGVKPPKA